MSVPYDVANIDLATPRDQPGETIPSTLNNPVGFVTVVKLPTGATVSLRFGGGKSWPLLNQGQFFDICPPERDGIAVLNEQSGGVLVLGISFDRSGANLKTGGQ